MPNNNHSTPIARARYDVGPKQWTATLRRFAQGPKEGRYVVDYWLPTAKPGVRARNRPEFVWSPARAESLFREFVRDEIVPSVAATLSQIQYVQAGNISESPTLKEIFDWYRRDVMVARGCGQATRDQNEVIFDRFVDFCKAAHVVYVADLADNRQIIDTYTAHLLTGRPHDKPPIDPKKPGTVKNELAKFKAAFAAALDRGIIPALPIPTWTMPKVPQGEFDMFSPEEFHAVLRRMETNAPAFYQVTRFLAYTGCRPSDAATLKWINIDLTRNTAAMHNNKTGRIVHIPLVGHILAAVESQIGAHPTHVFTKDGQPMTAIKIRDSIYLQAKHATGRNAGAKFFRRNVVSTLINSGADREHVRTLTGHRSDAIEKYLNVSPAIAQALAEQLQQTLNPTQKPTLNDTERENTQ